jgi:hypothetical protein
MPFTTLSQRASTALQLASQSVQKISAPSVFSVTFDTGLLTPGPQVPNAILPAIAEIDSWRLNGHRFIYFLTADTLPVQFPAVRAAFAAAKKQKLGGRAYARLNPSSSRHLYVGSSAAMTSRARQHLGHGVQGTYALNLAFWATGLNLRLTLTAARYPPNVNQTILGHLEDTLWDTLTPMFGRRGSK